MHGSLPQKIGRALGSLCLHPTYLSRCLTHNVFNGRTPLDLGIPWFSYAAIDFLDSYLRSDMTLCEYGSGGSTVFFARRVRTVVSIEDNARWFQLVRMRLEQEKIHNVSMRLCPFDFKSAAGFDYSAYLHAIPDERFDVIVVDGTEEWTPVRPACFRKAEDRIRKGGIVVLDDSWRYPAVRQYHHAVNRKTFKSVGPCRPGVTSTDVFFY